MVLHIVTVEWLSVFYIMAEGSRSAAERIPIEIIPNILQHLSTSDRKNARLVNSKWYHASRQDILQKSQKLVIDGSSYQNQSSLIFEVLEDGGCQYYNLEFHNMNFNSNSSEFVTFVQSNLRYTHSLSFFTCSFPFVMIEEIMLNCVNLEELHFKRCSCVDFNEATLIRNSKEKIVRKNLRVLEINSCDWFTNDVFEIFINVYPSMTKVRFAYYCGFKFTVNFDNSLENSKPLFLNRSISECFRDEFFDELMFHPWIKIEDLRINDPYYHYHIYEFEPFLLSQKELKMFDSSLCEKFSMDSFEFLMQQCPNLERLKHSLFWRRDDASVRRVLALVANSKLMIVTIRRFSFATEGAEFPKFKRNKNIIYLDIRSSQLGDTFLITILKTFCNLTYLDLSFTYIMGNKIQARKILFQNQIQLRYLKLNFCHWISNHAFKKCHLTKLEHLELTNSRITGAAFHKFNFPKLRFLCLNRCGAIADEDFTILPQICPLLMHLNVSGTRIQEKTVLRVCENFKFLHCVNVGKRNTPSIQNINVFSQRCPTLRFINLGNSGNSYHYNIFLKDWIKCDIPVKRCNRCEPSTRRLMDHCIRISNL